MNRAIFNFYNFVQVFSCQPIWTCEQRPKNWAQKFVTKIRNENSSKKFDTKILHKNSSQKLPQKSSKKSSKKFVKYFIKTSRKPSYMKVKENTDHFGEADVSS